MPIDLDGARAFARRWAAAWNDRDLDRILEHYAEDVVFHSPRIRLVLEVDVDAVRGREALRHYWRRALDEARDLYFEIDEVFVGADAVTLLYTNHRAQRVAETLVFDAAGKIVLGVAAYQ